MQLTVQGVFFTNELMVIIVCAMNVYVEQKSWTRSFIPFCVRMWVWKPVTTKEVNDVIALFVLMDIIQKPTLQCYFQKIISWQLLSWAVSCLWIGLNRSAVSHIWVYVRIQKHARNLSEFVLTWTEYCNTWVTKNPEGQTFFHTVYSPKGFQIWNHIMWSMWVQFGVLVLLCNVGIDTVFETAFISDDTKWWHLCFHL